MPTPLQAFLRGEGPDGSGRRLPEVLAFDDARIEAVHDVIQWLFPLPEPSRAVPGSPVLGKAEAAAIRADPLAQEGLRTALARMTRFYESTDAWLTRHDHNHRRITRILHATRNLLGPEEAAAFHAAITAREAAAGHPVDPSSRRYWEAATRG